MKYNFHIFAGAVTAMMIIFSCCVQKTAVIEKQICNQAAIDRYMQDCMKDKEGVNWKIHFKRCTEEANKEYCDTVNFLIINNVQVPCDSVPEQFKIFCK